MSEDNTTQCLLFPEIFRKPVVAQFDQREGSSDGGALLLKAAESSLWIGGWTSFVPSRRAPSRQGGSLVARVGGAASVLESPAATRTPTIRPA
jgi:hypothetical protein